MKCMIIRRADPDTEAGKMPSQELLAAMGRFNERLVDAGVFRDGTGLKPSSQAVRVSFGDGEPVVTDGPFVETRELIAGFTMIETDNFEQALDWVKQWPVEDAERGDLELEVRPVYTLEDFPNGEGLDVHQELAQRLSRQPTAIVPYLPFGGGRCREAFEFYAESLGGNVEQMLAWGDMPMPEPMPEERRAHLAHASLKIGELTLAGVDVSDDEAALNSGGNVILNFATPEQTRAAFAALSAGGNVRMEPTGTFWSSCFAVLTDRFGVHWTLNCEQAPAASVQ
jgi:uncharacterized glyoxalase superfamily protein PhnB